MGPKRILSEQEKVKRRQTSREFRKKKKETDPNWHKKEALFLHFKQQHFQTLSCPTLPKLDHTSKIYFL